MRKALRDAETDGALLTDEMGEDDNQYQSVDQNQYQDEDEAQNRDQNQDQRLGLMGSVNNSPDRFGESCDGRKRSRSWTIEPVCCDSYDSSSSSPPWWKTFRRYSR